MSTTALTLVDERSTTPVDARPRVSLLRPVAPIKDIIQSQNDIRAMVADALKRDRDYGIIPGTDKPSLWKPGAERLCVAFGLVSRIEILTVEADHDRPFSWRKRFKAKWGPQKGQWQTQDGESIGLYRYVVRCTLIHRETGEKMGEGIGACSTMEAKYIDRPRDCDNTVLKMAKKRAYVDATLTVFGLSDEFTQDEEDREDAIVVPEDEPLAPLTEESAAAMLIPGKPESWGGNGGKPIGLAEPKVLARLVEWLGSTDDLRTKYARELAAATMILEAKGGYTPPKKSKKTDDAPAAEPATELPAALADEPDNLPF